MQQVKCIWTFNKSIGASTWKGKKKSTKQRAKKAHSYAESNEKRIHSHEKYRSSEDYS